MKKYLSLFLAVVMTFICTGSVLAEEKPSPKIDVAAVISSDEQHERSLAVPQFSGFAAAEGLNARVDNLLADFMGEVNVNAARSPEMPGTSLVNTFNYTKSADVLSLQMDTYTYTGGAHGMSYKSSFTVNTNTGEFYTLASLFKPDTGYAKFLTEKIIAEINKTPDNFFPEAAAAVKEKAGNFDFYLDGNQLVIYFGLYELAPYAAGMSIFSFNADDFQDILKPEIYKAMVSAGSITSKISFNGAPVNTDKQAMVINSTIMVPLRAIAEQLGYKVDWNEKDGAIVAGGFIKEGVNSYYIGKRAPQTLAAAPVIIAGSTYVPIGYFTDVLDEFVLGWDEIKIYQQTGDEKDYRFYDQIVDFTWPTTESDCVEMYAKAWQERAGAIQYALSDSDLRAAIRPGLVETHWASRWSSPWVTSFAYQKTADFTYEITYQWTTSAGAEPPTTTILKLVPWGEFYRITEVIE